jgi:hypothetical protein
MGKAFYTTSLAATNVVVTPLLHGLHTHRNNASRIQKIRLKIEFDLELGSNAGLNFLDLTVIRTNNDLTFSVYRWPTTTAIFYPTNLIIFQKK